MIGWLDVGERRMVEIWPGVNHYCLRGCLSGVFISKRGWVILILFNCFKKMDDRLIILILKDE